MRTVILLILLVPVVVLGGCRRNADGTPDKLVIKGGDVQCARPGTELPTPLTVEVLGVHKRGLLGGKGSRKPVNDVAVRFSVIGRNTNLWFPDGNIVRTDEGGRASVRACVGKTVGDLYVEASFTRKDGSEKSAVFRVVSGVELLGDDQEAFACHTCAKPLCVKIYDASGNPLRGAEVFFTVEGGNKRAALSMARAQTDENGVADTYVTVGKETRSVEIIAEVVDPTGKAMLRGLRFHVMSLNRTLFFVTLIGGLAIFIFGMKTMADGLHRVAGTRLKGVLHFFTRNRVVGMLAGAGVTAAIQSSSACTVMVVGFVNAGLLSLQQAVGIVFGSNIGTTITAQIIAFKLNDIALPAVIIGLVMQMVGRRNITKFWGQVLLGFGLLFLGMTMMRGTLTPLRDSPTFVSFFHGFDCAPVDGVMPIAAIFWAVCIGTVMTVVVQSSSATVGLVMALASSGLINFYTAVPLVLGDNIGTTITANLAAIGGTRNARRTAIAHTLFNVVGTTTMIALFYVRVKGTPAFLYFINWVTPGNVFSDPPVNIARHVAMAHSVFNVFCVCALLPFAHQLTWLCERIIPVREHEREERLQYLEPHLLSTPSLAIVQVARELAYMTRRSMKMVEDAYRCLSRNSMKWEADVHRREEIVDELQDEISDYLAKLMSQMLTERESEVVPVLMHAVHDAERVGDLATNILKLAERRIEKRIVLSEITRADLDEMFRSVDAQCAHVVEALHTGNLEAARLCLAVEEKTNALQRRIAGRNIKEFDPKQTTVRETVLVLDALATFERIGDHLVNIAERIPTIAQFEPAPGEQS